MTMVSLFRTTLISLLLLIRLSGLAQGQEAVAVFGADEDGATNSFVIHGSTDVGPFTPILEGFSARYPLVSLRYEQRSTNDIFELADRACSEGRASADLLISSSIDQQFKLVNDGCAQSHQSAFTEKAPDWASWRNEIFGLTRELAVIIYNRELMPPETVPASRFDLIDLLRRPGGRFQGRVATYDIEQAGVGYLFAFADSQAATTYGRLIEAFGRNDVYEACCSAEIIDGVAEGRFLLAYNMLGSYALARAASDPRIGIVAPDDYTLVLSRAALVPRGAAAADLAKAFIDYALSPEGRQFLKEAGLIVSKTDGTAKAAASKAGLKSAFRPIAFTPSLLVGLDRLKKRQFLKDWRSGVRGDSN